jgi:hypothetical protein
VVRCPTTPSSRTCRPVRWIASGSGNRRPHSSAAVRWDATAPSPAASNATMTLSRRDAGTPAKT